MLQLCYFFVKIEKHKGKPAVSRLQKNDAEKEQKTGSDFGVAAALCSRVSEKDGSFFVRYIGRTAECDRGSQYRNGVYAGA